MKCGGIVSTRMGNYWTKHDPKNPERQPIGKCFQNNIAAGKNINTGCGSPRVFMNIQYLEPARAFGNNPRGPLCFDPVLSPKSLESLYAAFPNATIINTFHSDVQWWYDQVYKSDYPDKWQWCDDPFPNDNSLESMMPFYQEYQSKLDSFVEAHPSWKYIKIDIDNVQETPRTTGDMLEHRLGIPSTCWTDAMEGTLPDIATEQAPDTITAKLKRPNDINFPILVTALPKSGTTTIDEYFKCALGRWTAAHQWTKPTNVSRFPDATPIGKCMMENVKGNLPLLHDCGNARVWSDIGILQNKITPTSNGTCFYPTLHKNALERFYRDHPTGTLLMVVRNSTQWYQSTKKWNNLSARWSRARCEGFPPPGSTAQEWKAFYEQHTQRIRDFAKAHPSLTYIEVPLVAKETGLLLEDVFGVSSNCWGTTNTNKAGENIALPGNKKKKTATKVTTTGKTPTSNAAKSSDTTSNSTVST